MTYHEHKLTQADLNGRIYLPNLTDKDKITIICQDKEYSMNYNCNNGCITGIGLKDLHHRNQAKVGTVIQLTEIEENVYELLYIDTGNQKAINSVIIEEESVADIIDIVPNDIDEQHQHIVDDKSLIELIGYIKVLLKKYPFSFYRNETTVRSEIINPILDALGWKIPFLENEVACRNGGMVDYALMKNYRYKIVIETKSLYKDLDNAKCREQIQRYMRDPRFKNTIGIITNGYQWICYLPNGEKAIKTNIEDEYFVPFLKLLCFNAFNIDDIRQFNFENKNAYNIEKDFDIKYSTDKWKSIVGERFVADTFVKFVTNHKKEVLETCHLYKIEIVSRSPFRQSSIISIDGKNYYITRDNNNSMKRMIIQHIIYLFNIPAEIIDR